MGTTSYSQKGVQSKGPLRAFRLFIDEPMLLSIQKYTITHGQTDDKNFSEWGHLIFSKTINRNCYKELMNHLRFDNCSTRCERRQKDKFCLLLETWNNFIENCKKCYVPSFDLAIEEQLFPCKNWCPFIQYMPNKPDKFGIKLGLLVDVCSKYLCNGKPYLGKDPTRNGKNDLPTDFCLWLMQTFLK